MTELLTAAQMKAIEQAAIESGDVTGLELMERAGCGVVEAIFEEWPELAVVASAAGGQGERHWSERPMGDAPRPLDTPRDISGQKKRRAVVLCGPGNNGGDGFVVARLLHERGWEVEVFLYGDSEKLPPDARVNYERWDGACHALVGGSARIDPQGYELIVDALFGTGLARGLSWDVGFGTYLPERDSRHENVRPKIVAVDVPSGLCSDSGRALEGDTLWADLTVSFHCEKLGHRLADGPESCGKTVVKSIGLENAPASHKATQKFAGEILRAAQPRLSDKATAGHKYAHGHALILSGPSGHTGAARLAARGALRIGAGLVTLGVPADAQVEVAAQITAIMMRRIDESRVLQEVLKDYRLNALCLGPGLGIERARELVPVALGGGLENHPTRSVVLDADALTAYANAPDELFGMLHERCVLTPHAGEFARLFPEIAVKLNAPAYSKVDATREAAKRAGCVVLFKGPDTVIAAPDGRCLVNSAAYGREAPWLATAGSGDVIAGFITGLLARGYDSMQAAETSAWLHVDCALKFGPGLIAEDLPEQLPAVFRDLAL